MPRPVERIEIDRDRVADAVRRARELRAEWIAQQLSRLVRRVREALGRRHPSPAAGARASA